MRRNTVFVPSARDVYSPPLLFEIQLGFASKVPKPTLIHTGLQPGAPKAESCETVSMVYHVDAIRKLRVFNNLTANCE